MVNRDFVLGPEEREHFVRLLCQYERFCGVRTPTYCSLSNHFHLLGEIPARPAQLLSAEEMDWLIENRGLRFVLTGSSARKLRRGHANLLAVRAWRREMRPLCFGELWPAAPPSGAVFFQPKVSWISGVWP